ncbi:MAG: cohesin domain-containing protein [Anaerolineae bacterium]|nr:cohesin domain-containing protein [Anaerolineae bacterium]
MQSKKHIFAVIGIVLLVAANLFAVGAQDAAPRIWLASDLTQAAIGQEFSITVNVDGAEQIYGSSFKLSYDPLAFEVVITEGKAIVPGAFFQDQPGFELKNAASAQTGVIDYALTLMQPAQPVSGGGVIGTITFRALQDAPVVITATEASLVSPEFAEIDGRLVAQRINQVTAQIDNTLAQSTTVVAQSSTNNEEAASMFVNPELAGITAESPESAAPVNVSPAPRSNDVALIFAGVFFTAGLVLLTVSVGMYSRMRVRFSMLAEG